MSAVHLNNSQALNLSINIQVSYLKKHGCSFIDDIRITIDRAKELLKTPNVNVAQVSKLVEMLNKRVCRIVKKTTGDTQEIELARGFENEYEEIFWIIYGNVASVEMLLTNHSKSFGTIYRRHLIQSEIKRTK